MKPRVLAVGTAARPRVFAVVGTPAALTNPLVPVGAAKPRGVAVVGTPAGRRVFALGAPRYAALAKPRGLAVRTSAEPRVFAVDTPREGAR